MYDAGGHVRVAGSAALARAEGLGDPFARPGDRNRRDSGAALEALAEHTAVSDHGLGTSSEDLASFIECFSSYAQGRVLGTGHDQYSCATQKRQKFEDDTLADLIDGALEELADLVNYSSMAAVKLLSIRKRFVQ